MPSEVMCSYEGACRTNIPAMSECKCSPESGCIEIGKGSGHWRSGRRLHLMAIAVRTTTIRSCAGMSCTHTHTWTICSCVCVVICPEHLSNASGTTWENSQQKAKVQFGPRKFSAKLCGLLIFISLRRPASYLFLLSPRTPLFPPRSPLLLLFCAVPFHLVFTSLCVVVAVLLLLSLLLASSHLFVYILLGFSFVVVAVVVVFCVFYLAAFIFSRSLCFKCVKV